IYQSVRSDTGGWEAPQLVPNVNTLGGKVEDVDPAFSQDSHYLYLYFASTRQGNRRFDLYVSKRKPTEEWGSPELVDPWKAPDGVRMHNTRWSDVEPALSPDGKSLYFASNRANPSKERYDIYVCRRERLDQPWPQAVAVEEVNRDDSSSRAPFVAPDGA